MFRRSVRFSTFSFLRYRRTLLYIISILPSETLIHSGREGGKKGWRTDCPRQHLNDVETRARRLRPICVAVSRQSRDFVNYEILRFKRASYRNFRRSSVRQLSHVPRRCSSCLTRVHAQERPAAKVFRSRGKYSKVCKMSYTVQLEWIRARACVCVCVGGVGGWGGCQVVY